MNLLNKHKNIVFLGALALVMLLTPALPGQNRRTRQPRIPEEVLEHRMITESNLTETISTLQLWLNGKFSADPRNISCTVKQKMRNEDGATIQKEVTLKLTHQDFRKHASGFSALLTEPLIDDVMEVSAVRKEWYASVNKVCDEISTNLRRMDNARIRWSVKVYAREYEKFAANRKRCIELLSNRKQFEFSKRSDIMKELELKNKRRRAMAYREAQKQKAEAADAPGRTNGKKK